MSIPRVAFLALLAVGCATESQVKSLEDRLATLEKKVEEQGKAGPSAARPTAATPTPPADPEKEAAANTLMEEIKGLMEAGKMEEAKAKMDTLTSEYGTTQVALRARRAATELAVIGKPTPTLEVEKWFQGEGQVSLTDGDTTLVVFFEQWCPHCKREVPRLEETFNKYRGKGLQVVGLTRVSRSATDEKVSEFITEGKITYPVAKESGKMSEYFGVSGIPAAAVVKDGKVIWRGHPAKLTDEMLSSWL